MCTVHSVNLMMREIKTLVYCDLEATGLKSSGRPRISEVSLVAVNIEDVLELHTQIKSHLPEGPNENARLARVGGLAANSL